MIWRRLAIGILAMMWGVGPLPAGTGFAQDAESGQTPAPSANLSGFWRVVRQVPGSGVLSGRVTLRRQGADTYRVNYQLVGEDGHPWQAAGSAVVQGGNAWRGELVLDGLTITEIANLSSDGNLLSGRWHQAGAPTLVGTFQAVPMKKGVSALMAVTPAALKPGEEALMVLHGTGLDGPVDFGPGIDIVDTKLASPVRMEVMVRVNAGASPGARTVAVGGTRATGIFAVTE